MAIKIGILGYGNLGKGVELALQRCDDMDLVGIFTRRDPSSITPLTEGVAVYSVDQMEEFESEIDVMICCGGSAKDLPEQTPLAAQWFNVVDSFDTHAKIEEHFQRVKEVADKSKKVAIISVGWDPGLFSLMRLYGTSILPESKYYTFWGKGVSQGHSDAIRRVPGVKNAKQYTIPQDAIITAVRKHEYPNVSAREMHLRECYVVPEDGADTQAIEQAIRTMPDYFEGYETIVHFVTEEELQQNHSGMEHGGFVLCAATTGVNNEHNQMIEYKLELESNPEFTGAALVAFARAASNMYENYEDGCFTPFDVRPRDLSPHDGEELRAHLL